MIPPLAHGLVDISLVMLGRTANPAAVGAAEEAVDMAATAAPVLHPVAGLLVMLVVAVALNGWRHWRVRHEPALFVGPR